MNTTTTNIADFGARERKMAAKLLAASVEQGFPENFDQDGVELMMNMNSGNVFFTNANYDVCMMNGDDLEMWYFTPYSGHEGFSDELHDEFISDGETWNSEDVEYLHDLGIISDEEFEAYEA